jgi:hypothetical protein
MLGTISRILPAVTFKAFARQLAFWLLALSALLLATSPTRGASVIQFPVSACTVTEGVHGSGHF